MRSSTHGSINDTVVGKQMRKWEVEVKVRPRNVGGITKDRISGV